jgi:hypothetical protein
MRRILLMRIRPCRKRSTNRYNGGMERLRQRWNKIPATIRKPLVLIVGLLIVIISPFTGVLPGPGGIPVFLIGVAILATEFEWARRIRDPLLHAVHAAGAAWRAHKLAGTFVVITLAATLALTSLWFYSHFLA